MNTIIEKIRAEIERRITDNTFGAKLELIDILAWLDTLEKSEKPSEGLEEEIREFVEQEWDGLHDNDGNPLYTADYLEYIARHFAKWGAERQKEQDNEVADKALTTSIKLQEGWYAKGIADGEKSMKEQMMKEAVEIEWKSGTMKKDGKEVPFDGGKAKIIIVALED